MRRKAAPTRIVIATDGSATSTRAAVAARELIGTHHECHLVTVVAPREDPMGDVTGFAGSAVTPEEADREFESRVVAAHAALAATARALGDFPLDQQAITADDAADAICRVASAIDADLVVVGSNSAGAAAMLLGSVSAQVVRQADRPVLIVPASPG